MLRHKLTKTNGNLHLQGNGNKIISKVHFVDKIIKLKLIHDFLEWMGGQS